MDKSYQKTVFIIAFTAIEIYDKNLTFNNLLLFVLCSSYMCSYLEEIQGMS